MTAPAIHTLSCDLCGDTQTELREVNRAGWVPNLITCRPCFDAADGENDFTLLDMAQEASE